MHNIIFIIHTDAPQSLPKRVKYLNDRDHYCLESPQKEMTATPTNGQSCFPFAVNCRWVCGKVFHYMLTIIVQINYCTIFHHWRFDKTFFGVPKKCGYCLKMVYGTGFACQNCRFRCHKRCVMLSSNSQPYLRQKVCSLSRLPAGGKKKLATLVASLQ